MLFRRLLMHVRELAIFAGIAALAFPVSACAQVPSDDERIIVSKPTEDRGMLTGLELEVAFPDEGVTANVSARTTADGATELRVSLNNQLIDLSHSFIASTVSGAYVSSVDVFAQKFRERICFMVNYSYLRESDDDYVDVQVAICEGEVARIIAVDSDYNTVFWDDEL